MLTLDSYSGGLSRSLGSASAGIDAINLMLNPSARNSIDLGVSFGSIWLPPPYNIAVPTVYFVIMNMPGIENSTYSGYGIHSHSPHP